MPFYLSTGLHGETNESVCSKMKMVAKRPHAVQKEPTSFFAFSQSELKTAKDLAEQIEDS